MKKILLLIIIGSIGSVLFFKAGTGVKAGITGESSAQSIVDGIILYNIGDSGSESSLISTEKKIQDFIDNELISRIGGTAEWYVLGLSQYGDYDFETYRNALKNYLRENDVKGASAKLKFALLLSFVSKTGNDKEDEEFINRILNDESIGGQGIMSYVFGMHLLNNGYKGKVSKEEIVNTLAGLQHADGGWSVTGNNGDVDVTAMVLQSLAPFISSDESSIGPAEEMVAKAITFLSENQLEDGIFSSFGVRNAESTAQVITALSALNIDCYVDERFIKNGSSPIDGLSRFRLEDGSFSHKEDDVSSPSATVQVFYSMVAYLRMCKGQSPLYVLDKKEKTPSVTNSETDEVIVRDNESNEPHSVSDGEAALISDNKASSVSGNEAALVSGNKASLVSDGKTSGYKLYAILAILGLTFIFCIIFIILKKHWKNYVFVGLICVLGILIVLFTEFSSPEEYYGQDTEKNKVIGTVTMSIRCDILKGKKLNEHIPKDYCIMDTTKFELEDGETAYDILLEAAKKNGISVEHEGGSDIVYISGINYLYENDYGDLSGWVYKVNGILPSVGCGGYKLSDGDIIEWCYTLDLGNDAVG